MARRRTAGDSCAGGRGRAERRRPPRGRQGLHGAVGAEKSTDKLESWCGAGRPATAVQEAEDERRDAASSRPSGTPWSSGSRREHGQGIVSSLSTLARVMARRRTAGDNGAGRPATAAQEAEDERRDADLLAAVRDSMEQWEQKRARTRYSVVTINIS
ncbi:Uncharacterized protein OBRU01_14792 [Operophtera brumata]|uniref:Uncharacterized protein n=1 Tax=Operophtera brumata TaxID=104452 RepID=A0A0L7L5H1_OPEBR|nr:Uncharacterized protein OBRU01_14792 [Operophtera brumata]